jgi:uncharacterized protein (DUF427 family)
MLRAVWNGPVLADAAQTVRLEGNHYFPPESINWAYVRPSETTTICPLKGEAHYYHVVVDGEVNPEAAWDYSRPSPLARKIKNHVAFWSGVVIDGQPESRSAGTLRPATDRADPLAVARSVGPHARIASTG